MMNEHKAKCTKNAHKKYNAIFDKSIVLYAKIWYNKSNAVV